MISTKHSKVSSGWGDESFPSACQTSKGAVEKWGSGEGGAGLGQWRSVGVQGWGSMRSDFGARGTGFGVLRNHSLCGRSGRGSPAQG